MKKTKFENTKMNKKLTHVLIPFGMVLMVLPITVVVSCGSGSSAGGKTKEGGADNPPKEPTDNGSKTPENTPSKSIAVAPVEISKDKIYDTQNIPLRYLMFMAYDYKISSGKPVNISWKDSSFGWKSPNEKLFGTDGMDALDTMVGSLFGGDFVEENSSNGKEFDGVEMPINDISFVAKLVRTFNEARFMMPLESDVDKTITLPYGPIDLALQALKKYGPNILSKSPNNLNAIKLEIVAFDGTKFYLIDDKTDVSSLTKNGEKFTFNSLNTSADTMKPLDFTIRMSVA